MTASITHRHHSAAVETLLIENAWASAEISLFGAQVLSFIPHHDGRDRLWLSEKAIWDGITPIRGGIPLCWPWFGAHRDPQLPAHGYVRNRQWQLSECHEGINYSEFLLVPESASCTGFAGQADLSLRLRIGLDLELLLTTSNTGDTAFQFTCALHSYFRVTDIEATRLHGLQGEYSDKTRDWAILPSPEPYVFSEETDRIHLQPAADVDIECLSQHTRVHSSGHDSVVVWNPWEENAAAMADMNSRDYRHMLCVETALTDAKNPVGQRQGLQLQPGEKHRLLQRIS